ncbi:MAG: hypothetical protein MZV64_72065 [Ignavibacteriales bacterium]|nr:hypothetical protein [Ignavibacteriales bacterium]
MVKNLIKDHNARILIFGGPEEKELKEQILFSDWFRQSRMLLMLKALHKVRQL